MLEHFFVIARAICVMCAFVRLLTYYLRFVWSVHSNAHYTFDSVRAQCIFDWSKAVGSFSVVLGSNLFSSVWMDSIEEIRTANIRKSYSHHNKWTTLIVRRKFPIMFSQMCSLVHVCVIDYYCKVSGDLCSAQMRLRLWELSNEWNCNMLSEMYIISHSSLYVFHYSTNTLVMTRTTWSCTNRKAAPHSPAAKRIPQSVCA